MIRSWTIGIALLLASTAWAEERMQIEVQGSGGRGYQVALQHFAERDGAFGLEDRFHQALDAALDFSGALAVVDEGAFLGPKKTEDLNSRIQCDNWKGIGADALVQGELSADGGEVKATYRVWDTVRCRMQGDTTQASRDRGDLELMAREIADDIVERFTGRRGVSSTQIAFVSDKTGNKEIYLMEANGAGKRAVTRNGAINLFPAWAPDGRSLLYTSFKQGRPDVWKIYRGTKPGHVVVKDPSDKFRGVYAPNGSRRTRLALVMNRAGNTDIYAANGDGRSLKRLTNGHGIETSPTFSPDGKRMAFVSDRVGSPQVYLKDLETGEERRLTFRGDYNADPAWSPTGEWIAYSALTGTSFDLYLIDPETGFTTPLVVNPRGDEDPAWSPDGRKIAFSSARRGRKEIYRIDVDGHNLVRLTDGFGNCTEPAWSGWFQ